MPKRGISQMWWQIMLVYTITSHLTIYSTYVIPRVNNSQLSTLGSAKACDKWGLHEILTNQLGREIFVKFIKLMCYMVFQLPVCIKLLQCIILCHNLTCLLVTVLLNQAIFCNEVVLLGFSLPLTTIVSRTIW